MFRFSLKSVAREKIAEILRCGVPSVFGMASSVILIFVLNRLLLARGGSEAVAAYAVISTLGNAANCTTTGIGGVTLTLAGIFFGEEDRTALKTLMRLIARYCVFLGAAVGLALAAAARPAVALFIPKASAAQDMAVAGVRLYALGLIPCCLNSALKNAYQATGRVLMTEIMSLAEGAILPALAAAVLSAFLGVTGIWLYYIAGEALALCLLGVYVTKKRNVPPWRSEAYLLIDDGFGASGDDLKEWDIRTLEQVTAAAEEAEAFCLRHGQSAKTGAHIALCIEEMASNTVLHGFGAQPGKRHLAVRLLNRDDHFVVRFRDDCRAFDPVNYVPKEGKDALGIRLTAAMADEIRYTYSLNLNNLTLEVRKA